MTDLLLPHGRNYRGWEQIAHLAPQSPLSVRRTAAASAAGHEQIDEAVYVMGRSSKPTGSLVLYTPAGFHVILTDGETELSELAEIAHAAMDKKPFDFDAARERANMVRRENVGAAAAEALQSRIRRHKANPVTDPPRQPLRWV